MRILILKNTFGKLEHMILMDGLFLCPALALNKNRPTVTLKYQVTPHVLFFHGRAVIANAVSAHFTQIADVPLVLYSDLPICFLPRDVAVERELVFFPVRQSRPLLGGKIIAAQLPLFIGDVGGGSVLKRFERRSLFEIEKPRKKRPVILKNNRQEKEA